MSKGCYTCRRRRIVCDNGRPTCRKCHDAGKECLGYRKPLVWVKGGVASRGKMMGLSFNDVTSNQDSPGRASMGFCTAASSGQTRIMEQAEQHPCESETLPDDGTLQIQVRTLPETTLAEYYNNNGALVHVRRIPPESPSFSLVDPLFQDVDKLSRLYISHFNLHCAQALCLYDKVRNPYRELISYIGESPVLTDSLAAIGAIHHAYMCSNEYQFSSSSDNEATEMHGSLLSLGRHPVSFSAQPSNAKAFSHFLSLKQRALRQLSIDVSHASTRNDDRTIAAIFVLILLDALESGNGAWKYHLEGAKSILRDRLLTANHSATTEGIDTFVIDSCLITEIMGSTLARPGVLSKPFYSQSMGAAVLQRLEKTAWVGCPAYLLDAMFFVHAQRFSNYGNTPGYDYTLSFLSSATGETATDSPLAILRHIDAFDPVAWAGEMQSYLFLSDVSHRVALACAYKAAVYLYARRVVSVFGFGRDADEDWKDRDTVERDLVHNLSLIRPDDEHFKCTIWPTFIAGAESTLPEQRAFTLQNLYLLWNDFCSVNLHNAACVLKMMWQKQDERSRSSETATCSEFDWIQELDQSRTDWLFI
ncbi:Acriflavine sensitivity control protein acr-2 [Talaromyces islandicus]|uniref:Acriflavine sensitivity control protein acr-2 n=1 Tax=Talaromyces islandicus TaxID=28573 RepID=A0A0U1MBB1_TALIS|nr:Acriflavine sensitivity control protein acr-2 [Talaromyces islandicus]